MSQLVIPHSYVAGQTLPAQFLNDNDDAIAAVVNALDDNNLVAGAGIKGSKLANAPNGIPTGKYNDLSVTTGKLAVGAATPNRRSVAATVLTATQGSGSHVLVALPAITTRGGTVLLLSGTGGHVTLGGGSVAGLIRFLILRDATLLGALDYNLNGLSAEFSTVPLAAPAAIDTPAAGTYVYTVTVESLPTGGVCTFATNAVNPGGYAAVELA